MRKFIFVLFALVLVLSLSLVTAVPVSADVSVTPASGGGAISADTYATGTYTELGPISIAEGAAADIGTGTIILNVPDGFEFQTTPTPDVAVTGTTPQLAAEFTSITTTQLTVTVTAASTTETDNVLTIGGVTAIGVRPTQGTPLKSGDIVMDATSTSTIAGVTPGTTNFGTLTEVPSAFAGYTVVPAALTQEAGTAFTITITAVDQFENTNPSGIDDATLNTYTFTFSGPSNAPDTTAPTYPIAPAFLGGVWAPSVTLVCAETVALTVTDNQATPMTGTSALITVNPAPHDAYTVVPAALTQTAGTAFTVTITAVDEFENTVTTIDATLDTYTFTFSGPSNAPDTTAPTYPTTPSFTSGVWAPSVTLVCAETVALTVTDDQATPMTGTSALITVNPGALASFTITGTPAGVLAGTAFPSPITVTAYDTWGNVKTDYDGTITWSSSASASLPADYTFVVGVDNGVHIFPGSEFTLFSAGIHTITVTDGLVSAPSSGIAVTAVIGGWAPPAPTPTIEANLFGSVLSFSISDTGEILETVTGTSADGNLTLTIPAGTIALDKDGNPLSTLTSDVDVSPPPPPSHIIGLAYDFRPDGATFDPALTLTWSYDPDALPEGVAEEDLVIAYYDEEAGEWVECECICDPETNCVTGCVCHFTCFAIIAPPVPAAFSVSNLSIQPSEVQPKEAVTITLSVANTGGMEGSYAVVLKINDVKETEKSVTVAAGSSQSVSFSVTREEAGTYSVAMDGLSGSFTVVAPPPPPPPPPAPPPEVKPSINWPLIGGSIAGVVVVGLVIFFLVVRRRAY